MEFSLISKASLLGVNCKPLGKYKFSRSNPSKYLSFINKQSSSGLECTGSETSLKECHLVSNATFNQTNLFELEIECVGKVLSKYCHIYLSNLFCF